MIKTLSWKATGTDGNNYGTHLVELDVDQPEQLSAAMKLAKTHAGMTASNVPVIDFDNVEYFIREDHPEGYILEPVL